MMKGLKRLVMFAMSAVLLLSVTLFSVGCSKQYDIHVFMMANTEENAFNEALFAEMKQELGIKIKYTGHTWSDYFDMLKYELQATPPDVFFIRPDNIKQLVKDGQLEPLNDYLESEAFTSTVDISKIYPLAVDAYRYDGTNVGVSDKSAPIYGINRGFSYQGLGYNRKLVARNAAEFAAAHLKMPWELSECESYTFGEFAQVLQICTKPDGGGANGSDPVFGMDASKQIMSWLWSMGGDVMSADGQTIKVDTPEMKAVLQYVMDGIDGNYMNKDSGFGDWDSSKIAFYGSIGNWETPTNIAHGIDFDVMPWPSVNGDDNWYGEIGTSALGVSAHSKNKQLAKQIAASFYSERTADKMVKAGLALPIYIDTAENGYLEDDETYKPAHRKIFIDVISGENGKMSPVANSYSTEWYDAFVNDLDKVWNKTQGIEDYLKAKEPIMQELFNRDKGIR